MGNFAQLTARLASDVRVALLDVDRRLRELWGSTPSGRVFSVEIPEGTADAAPLISAAIRAAVVAGGNAVVVLPAGDFIIQSPIWDDDVSCEGVDGVTIRGQGRHSTVLRRDVSAWTTGDPVFRVTGIAGTGSVNSWRLEGFSLMGGEGRYGGTDGLDVTGHAIQVEYCHTWSYHDLEIMSFAGSALNATDCWDCHMSHVLTQNCGYTGSPSYATLDFYDCNNWEMSNIHVQGAEGWGLVYDGSATTGHTMTSMNLVASKFECDSSGAATTPVPSTYGHVDLRYGQNFQFSAVRFGRFIDLDTGDTDPGDSPPQAGLACIVVDDVDRVSFTPVMLTNVSGGNGFWFTANSNDVYVGPESVCRTTNGGALGSDLGTGNTMTPNLI